MAANDYAILVGISEYPNPGFASLGGPSNDIALVRKWLVDPNGGDLPDDADHVRIVASPQPYPAIDDPDVAPPTADAFDLAFRKLLRQRMALKEQRVKGRLYLYFSGHGFCSRRMNRDSEAALYSANATKEYYDHIFGTQYARVAKGKALFKEVVLIMDCCRDSEVNREPTPRPYTDTPDDDLAAEVPLLAIYAVAKGGKAQERPVAERGDKVHGLLTHALMKALDDVRPGPDGLITSSALRDYVRQSWEAVCGPEAAPRPEFSMLGSDEIKFRARNGGTRVTIKFDTPRPPGTMLILRDGKFKGIAEFSATGDASKDSVTAPDAVLVHQRNGSELVMRLVPGLYEYELTPGVKDRFKAAGGDVNVSL